MLCRLGGFKYCCPHIPLPPSLVRAGRQNHASCSSRWPEVQRSYVTGAEGPFSEAPAACRFEGPRDEVSVPWALTTL